MNAGFLRHEHDDCRRLANEAKKQADQHLSDVHDMVQNAVTSGQTALSLLDNFTKLRNNSALNEQDIRKKLLQGADQAAMRLAHECPVSNDEIERVADIFTAIQSNFWEQGFNGLAAWHGYISLTFSNTLYQILHGETPYMDPETQLEFRLGRDEHLIQRTNATLAEYRTKVHGGVHQAVSFPIGKGMYYRLGADTPRSQHSALTLVDRGSMAITTEALYFGGQKSTFRIPFTSIIRLEPYSDAIGIYENYGTGKVFIPFTLGFDAGWYYYNVIAALIDRAK